MGHPKRGHFGGACAKSGPAEGGGTDLCFPCVRGPARVAQLKIQMGGTALYFFRIVEATKNRFHLCIAIVDNADLPSLCLQVHTVIFVKNTTPM